MTPATRSVTLATMMVFTTKRFSTLAPNGRFGRGVVYSKIHLVHIEFPPCILIFRSFSHIEATESTEEGNGE